MDTKNQPIQRFCVSDEHYTPTLLAFLGLDNETDCVVGLAPIKRILFCLIVREL